MIPEHTPTRIPPTLRQRAITHRRLALAALRDDSPESFRLSRYWSHIGQARALEALARAQRLGDNQPASLVGGAQ
jgi:hypothetical protein